MRHWGNEEGMSKGRYIRAEKMKKRKIRKNVILLNYVAKTCPIFFT